MTQINRTAGTVIEIIVDVLDSEGEPLNLTGADLTFVASSKDGETSIVKTELDGIELDAVTGRLMVIIDEADTSALVVPKNLLWDLTVTDLFGDTREVARGKIALRLPVASLIA